MTIPFANTVRVYNVSPQSLLNILEPIGKHAFESERRKAFLRMPATSFELPAAAFLQQASTAVNALAGTSNGEITQSGFG